jgi:Domain of unknown function (DUF4382)
MKRLILGTIAISAFSLAACGPLEESELVVLLTDAPGNYEQVPITVDGLQVRTRLQQSANKGEGQQGGAWVRTMTQSMSRDLLQLRDGKTASLGEATIPAGEYDRIRMVLSKVQVVAGGQTHDLAIPSGEGAGLELQHAFSAQAGARYELLLDLDAEQSISHDGQAFRFQAALSVKHVRVCAAGEACPDPSEGGAR